MGLFAGLRTTQQLISCGQGGISKMKVAFIYRNLKEVLIASWHLQRWAKGRTIDRLRQGEESSQPRAHIFAYPCKWRQPQRIPLSPQRIFNTLVSRRFEPPPSKARELATTSSSSAGTRVLLIRQVLTLIGTLAKRSPSVVSKYSIFTASFHLKGYECCAHIEDHRSMAH